MNKLIAWNQTLNGGFIDLLDPKPEQIDWRELSIALARQARFNGHTPRGFYSVAQHCMIGAAAIYRDTRRMDWAAAFLLHDAHEAYIGDDTSPKLKALETLCCEMASDTHAGEWFKQAYRSLQKRLAAAIYAAAGAQWPLSAAAKAIVKEYDLRMLRTERDALLAVPPFAWDAAVEGAKPILVALDDWFHGDATAVWLYYQNALKRYLPELEMAA